MQTVQRHSPQCCKFQLRKLTQVPCNCIEILSSNNQVQYTAAIPKDSIYRTWSSAPWILRSIGPWISTDVHSVPTPKVRKK